MSGMEITEKQVMNWVGTRSFERGEEYFEEDMIYGMIVIDNTLQGKSQGSSLGNEYTLNVTVENDFIVKGRCSCPVGAGGRCKHIAAFLLEWIHNSDEFVDILQDLECLESLAKSELVRIIKDLIKINPENQSYLENILITNTAIRKEDSHDLFEIYKDYLANIQDNIPSGNQNFYVESRLLDLLEPHTATIDKLMNEGRFDYALSKCLALVNHISEIYNSNIDDNDGNIALVIDDLTKKIILIFEINAVQISKLDLSLISEIFLNTIITDIKAGGQDYGWAARKYLPNITTKEKEIKSHIVKIIQDEISAIEDKKSNDWEIKAYQALISQLNEVE